MGYVIVLDPGHGGEEDGGGIGTPYVVKQLDLMTAQAMKAYLEKFEGVTVYLTRSDDTTLSLQQRLDIAKAYNADYFICLHYNMSAAHSYYGSEVWLQAQKTYYNKMYAFADEVLKNTEEMGLFNRGIKTRISSKGDNYYGVLRIGADYGIPACIIEHCHMDNARDTAFLPTQKEALASSCAYFGMKDADAMAKFLHLKSTELGVDYTNYKTTSYKTSKTMVYPDETEPEIDEISIKSIDTANNTAVVSIHAVDKQSFIEYYMVSYDGGASYASLNDYPRTAWNKSVDNVDVTIALPKNKDNILLNIAVVNSFDKIALSNTLLINVSTGAVTTASSNASLTESLEIQTLTKTTDGNGIISGNYSLGLAGEVLFNASLIFVLGLTAFKFIKKRSKDET